eukprot:scaffold192514_cov22-Prasinocladus_malaysianus.AAC.2
MRTGCSKYEARVVGSSTSTIRGVRRRAKIMIYGCEHMVYEYIQGRLLLYDLPTSRIPRPELNPQRV